LVATQHPAVGRVSTTYLEQRINKQHTSHTSMANFQAMNLWLLPPCRSDALHRGPQVRIRVKNDTTNTSCYNTASLPCLMPLQNDIRDTMHQTGTLQSCPHHLHTRHFTPAAPYTTSPDAPARTLPTRLHTCTAGPTPQK
jgi:hypothetical protein